jgi:hypothetical protein
MQKLMRADGANGACLPKSCLNGKVIVDADFEE